MWHKIETRVLAFKKILCVFNQVLKKFARFYRKNRCMKMISGYTANGDRLQQLKAFDESKSGVKGIVDKGITKIPPIFVRPPEFSGCDKPSSGHRTRTQFSVPVVDLTDTVGRRADVVAGVRRAAETVGFFQVVNHGIPKRVLDEMLAAARGFHELHREVKSEYYSRELLRKVKFGSNFDLYQSRFANWRDSLFCVMGPEPLDPQELPLICRDITMEYSENVHKMGVTLFELLSEALGLKPDHLIGLDCAKGHLILSHYYPPCPEPELTMGTSKHSDPDFLTILLQDQIGGLQVLYENQWIDVPPVPGALVVNIGDLLQLVSNDRFKSVEHQVLANHAGPRVSIACFLTPHLHPSTRLYGPIKELLSEDRPPVYKETSLKDFIAYYDKKGLDGNSALTHFKCQR
ncbi:PREDICTED: 1-aminocyclopropane-1-carboxylate oxidase homolog 1-like [Prunus mume]|uniref:1-aminocyclopropane-1-carboxylate oxidase homolog 1-like n=1 Tax=Prunus mume TaxID=102107 RepID=A0ABM0NGA8_PRUMU|nr:PREDICTED: 1-aminocyclopropane-1-carboxylate oxidase homolog 1-like [Prunus mume]